MKKLVALLLALLLVFSMVACSNGFGFGKDEESEEESTREPKSDKKDPSEISSGTDLKEETEPEEEEAPVIEMPEVTLNHVGEVRDPSNDIYVSNCAFYEYNGDTKFLLDLNGDNLQEEEMTSVKYLGADLYVAAKASDALCSTGMVTESGEVLIPFDAAYITTLGGSQRFVKVCYAVAETNVDSEALLSKGSSGWSADLYGDTLYTGYCKVYDLDTRQFVANVSISNYESMRYMWGTDDTFMVKDEAEVTRIYDADGQIVLETDCEVTCNSGIYCEMNPDKDGWVFYSSKGEFLSVSASRAHVITGSGEYLAVTRDDQYIVHDTTGELISDELCYDDIISEDDGVFVVQQDWKYGLAKLDGTVIAPVMYSGIENLGYGIYSARDYDADTVTLLNKEGRILLVLEDAYIDDLAVDNGEDPESWFIYSDEDFTLTKDGSYVEYGYCSYLLKSYNDGKYGLYSLFNGEELLEEKYDDIRIVGGYLVAKRDNIWHVYEVEVN